MALLSKHLLLRNNRYPSRDRNNGYACDNRGTAVGSVFHAVPAEAIYREWKPMVRLKDPHVEVGSNTSTVAV
jgi:hypothetical protein